MTISARKHKRRSAAGMARRLLEATRLALKYGPACHPFRVRLQWSYTSVSPWNPVAPELFQNDRAVVDYSRAVSRGREADRA